jgi:RNA polymerase sigma factor (sigma-70 family)
VQEKNTSEYWRLIWDRFRAGDRQAFGILYNEYIDTLYAYGAKITADRSMLEDSIQDLFIDAYTYGRSLRQPEYLEFYLYKTLKRIIIRNIKEINRYKMTAEIADYFDLLFPVEESVDEENLVEERIQILRNEVRNLDSKRREILFLKFNSGLTYNEIALFLGQKPDTVKKQVYRVLVSLRGKITRPFMGLFLSCFRAIR